MTNSTLKVGIGISKRFTFTIATAYGSLIALLSLLAAVIVLPRFATLERERHDRNVQRVEEVAIDILTRPSGKVKDWSNWDDAHSFVLATDGNEQDAKFRTVNFFPDNLDYMGVDSIRFAFLDGRLRASLDKKDSDADKSALDSVLTEARMASFIKGLQAKKDAGDETAGTPEVRIVNTTTGPVYISYALVNTSSGTVPPSGLVIFAKRLTPEFATMLSRLSKLNATLETAEPTDIVASRPVKLLSDGNLVESARIVTGAKPTWPVQAKAIDEPSNDKKIDAAAPVAVKSDSKETSDTAGRLSLRDLDGKIVATVFFPLSRGISGIGAQATLVLVAGVFVLLLACAMFLRASLARSVVRPITSLASEVRAIRSDDKTEEVRSSPRVEVPAQRGEVTLLATDINDLLATIEERNKALSDISKNVTVGVLISDAHGHVLGGHTHHALALLTPGTKASTLQGGTFSQLLFPHAPREKENFDALYEQVFEDLVPEDITLSMLPERIPLGDSTLALSGAGLRDAKSALVGILWTIVDITEQVEAERQNRMNAALLRILRRTEPFRAFVGASRAAFAALRGLYGPTPMSEDDERELRRALHTLKGNFGVYGLSELADRVHIIEESQSVTLEQVEALDARFESDLEEIRRTVGISFDDDGGSDVALSSDELSQAQAASAEWKSLEAARLTVTQFLTRALQPRFGDHIEPLRESTVSIAARYGKKINIHFVGSETKVPAHMLTKVVDSLTHALRNSVHHGIEAPSARKSAGKSDEGEISIRFEIVAGGDGGERLNVTIDDDGRGFDVEALRAKAVGSGLLAADRARALSDAEAIELVFEDGLSTAAQVNDIAGRGVGMSAIRKEMVKMGGRVVAERRSDSPGSRIRFEVPLNAAQKVVKAA